MVLWLRRDIAVHHPCAVDKMMLAAGIVKSLTEARRQIADGAVYLNNEKLVPPEKEFLPVIIVAENIPLDEYIALGITDELAMKILAETKESDENSAGDGPDPRTQGAGGEDAEIVHRDDG